MPCNKPLTWDYLVTHEPILSSIEWVVRTTFGQPWELESFFARTVKPEMARLVGWFRKRESVAGDEALLRSERAYLVALRHLYSQLQIEDAA